MTAAQLRPSDESPPDASILENAPLLGQGQGAADGLRLGHHRFAAAAHATRGDVAYQGDRRLVDHTATMTGVAIRLASTKPDRYLAGLTNNEGLGAMLSHIGVTPAHGSTRRLVVVPQYESSHCGTSNEEAVMDYAVHPPRQGLPGVRALAGRP